MTTGTTTVRVSTATAGRIAALREEGGGSTDAVVRAALDALYWSRMVESSRRMTPTQREEYRREAALWDRAAAADAARQGKT